MVGSHETNPNTKKATTSKKSKSKMGKSGHSHSEKSGKTHEHNEREEQSGQNQEWVQEQQAQTGDFEQQQQQYTTCNTYHEFSHIFRGAFNSISFANKPQAIGQGLFPNSFSLLIIIEGQKLLYPNYI